MKKMIKILEGFDKRRNDRNKEEWEKKSLAEKYEEIAQWFRPCAEQILCNGYFLVNGEYIIDLGAIELYYHEEEGEIKDYIMYHINDRTNSKIKQFEGGLPYFEFGSFNFHLSGIDITFENPKEKYRASFLIRSYRVLKTENGLYPDDAKTKYDTHPTHIFDDMFYVGVLGTEIVWIPTDKKNCALDTEPLTRINVAVCEEPDVKSEAKIMEEDYLKDPNKYIKVKVNEKYYKQDMRPWRFQLKDIEEEK
ncbi:MAG: hypothetical protein J6T98_06580 [Salinivirgaceae bacterium]|nr:hypothetical protein [Salinivirgaceae bacterium]